jgi:hypothetical protein
MVFRPCFCSQPLRRRESGAFLRCVDHLSWLHQRQSGFRFCGNGGTLIPLSTAFGVFYLFKGVLVISMIKSIRSFCVSGATAISFLLCVEAPSRALTTISSAVFSPVLQVDGGSSSTGLAITGLTSTISNVLVTVNLTKCDGTIGSGSISSSGVCTASGFSQNNEIFLSLTSPDLTELRLVVPGQLGGQTPGDTVTWSFQEDPSASLVGGSLLVSGNYRPLDSFSSFVGESGNGNWLLTYGDSFLGDPLSLNSWSISVTDSSTPGPGPTPADVPGPLPLFGLAAAFGWSRLLRKRIRARRDLRPGS